MTDASCSCAASSISRSPAAEDDEKRERCKAVAEKLDSDPDDYDEWLSEPVEMTRDKAPYGCCWPCWMTWPSHSKS